MSPFLFPMRSWGSGGSPAPRSRGEANHPPSPPSPATRLLDQHAQDMLQAAGRGSYDPPGRGAGAGHSNPIAPDQKQSRAVGRSRGW